jgi:protocatechuate 3,4-dioxygenase beta subunit
MNTPHLADHAGAPADHDDFGGLHRDLAATRQAVAGLTAKRFSRRHMVRALGVVVPAAVAVGCGDDASPTSPTSSTSTSADATLAGLTLSTGSISPSFSAANTAYTAAVENAVASATVTAMSASSTATIKVNGTTVATGVPSAAVTLALGTTTITVAVTAADNATTRTYTIVVTRSDTVASSCTGQQRIPNETAGPYPGDGTNGPNVLVMSGVVRSDITSSFGGMSGVAPGVPLTIILRLVSASTCQPLAGYAVYLWHCTRDGGYSLYTSGFTSQNYLRGIQEADATGQATFQSIYPGCYSGRWPHIHFEVFPSLGASNSAGNKVATSQIALPRAQNDEVYATAGYESSVRNQANVSLSSDNVFGDGYSLELATVTGSVATGYTAMLTVAI